MYIEFYDALPLEARAYYVAWRIEWMIAPPRIIEELQNWLATNPGMLCETCAQHSSWWYQYVLPKDASHLIEFKLLFGEYLNIEECD